MEKPRIRVKVGDTLGASARAILHTTADSFENFASQLGIGTNNQLSAGTYGFNPITRNRILLEWAHRGNWVAGVAIDAVAEDMTRAGIEIVSNQLTSAEIDTLQASLKALGFWQNLAETIKWGRLYGGAIGVMMIEGQDPQTPLRPNTIGRGQFKGIYPMDRWMVEAGVSPNELVRAFGPSTGLPTWYRPISEAPIYPNQKIHYSRVVRTIGYKLPYYQAQTEMYWGISILERLYDRLIAFDSTTLGAAQLVNKAHLRTISIEKLRELIAFGGQALAAVKTQVEFIRLFQTNEGITLLDASDKFDAHQYTFSGLGDMLLQFAQQVAGALQIPLVRLFGQSPAGMNATGESDFRNYYDGINASQEAVLRNPIHTVLEMLCLSVLGKPFPLDAEFKFTPLWQLTPIERSSVAKEVTESVTSAFESGLIPGPVALEELRTASRLTGMWTSISDETIQAAQNAPPLPLGGAEGGAPGEMSAGAPSPPAQAGAEDDAGAIQLAPPPVPSIPDPVSGMMLEDETQPDEEEDGMSPGPAHQIDIFLPNGGEIDIQGGATIQ